MTPKYKENDIVYWIGHDPAHSIVKSRIVVSDEDLSFASSCAKFNGFYSVNNVLTMGFYEHELFSDLASAIEERRKIYGLTDEPLIKDQS